MFKRSCFALVLVLLCAKSAPGAMIAYEGFDYPALPLIGQNGGFGFAAPWLADPGVIVQPPGLSSPLGLLGTGLSIGGEFNAARQLAGPLNQPQFWASFQIMENSLNDQVFLGFDLAPSATPLIAFGRQLNTYFIQQAGSPAVLGGVASGVGSTDLLVARFTRFGGLTTVDLWVNTPSYALPPLLSITVPTVPYTFADMQVQNGFLADEVHLGTLPSDVSAVPEPGSLGLLALAAVCRWLRPRRSIS